MPLAPADSTSDDPREPEAPNVLRSPETGGRVVRGSAIRGVGFGLGVLLGVGSSVLLLRYLGVADFGRFITVAALLGIVSGVTDAGLTAVGQRELAIRDSASERARVLSNLILLRLVITPLGVAVAVGFAFVAGYDDVLILGAVLGGIGITLVNLQATMMLPLSVELNIGRLTVVEVLKQALTLFGVAFLVVAGASLLPFFAIQILVGVGVLAVTPLFVGRVWRLLPSFDRDLWGMLVREALPIAVALTANVIYFRVLVIEMSLIASEEQAGFFATSFRIFEVLLALPILVLSVALPVLSVAGEEDRERLRYWSERLTQVALVVSIALALVIAIPAEAIVRVLGGAEFAGAAPVLQVQALALVALFVGQGWQLVLIAVRRTRSLAVANAIALAVIVVLGLVMIPSFDAVGAAWTAVIAETVLALLLLAFLALAGRDLVPSLGVLPRVALPAAAAAAVSFVPGLPDVAAAAAALVVFAAGALALGAVPREVVESLRPGRTAG